MMMRCLQTRKKAEAQRLRAQNIRKEREEADARVGFSFRCAKRGAYARRSCVCYVCVFTQRHGAQKGSTRALFEGSRRRELGGKGGAFFQCGAQKLAEGAALAVNVRHARVAACACVDKKKLVAPWAMHNTQGRACVR